MQRHFQNRVTIGRVSTRTWFPFRFLVRVCVAAVLTNVNLVHSADLQVKLSIHDQWSEEEEQSVFERPAAAHDVQQEIHQVNEEPAKDVQKVEPDGSSIEHLLWIEVKNVCGTGRRIKVDPVVFEIALDGLKDHLPWEWCEPRQVELSDGESVVFQVAAEAVVGMCGTGIERDGVWHAFGEPGKHSVSIDFSPEDVTKREGAPVYEFVKPKVGYEIAEMKMDQRVTAESQLVPGLHVASSKGGRIFYALVPLVNPGCYGTEDESNRTLVPWIWYPETLLNRFAVKDVPGHWAHSPPDLWRALRQGRKVSNPATMELMMESRYLWGEVPRIALCELPRKPDRLNVIATGEDAAVVIAETDGKSRFYAAPRWPANRRAFAETMSDPDARSKEAEKPPGGVKVMVELPGSYQQCRLFADGQVAAVCWDAGSKRGSVVLFSATGGLVWTGVIEEPIKSESPKFVLAWDLTQRDRKYPMISELPAGSDQPRPLSIKWEESKAEGAKER